jgi:hypothetical protein
VLRDQLITELKAIHFPEEAALWARRILPAKNTLHAEDARQLENVFAVRVAEMDDGKADLEAQPESMKPAENVNDGKSSLLRMRRDKDHLRFVAKQACLICGRTPADPHHIRFAQLRALGRKVSDEFCVPLCRGHHREPHRYGNESAWWKKVGIDPRPKARALRLQTHPLV